MRYPSYMRRHKKAASVREPVSLYEAKTHLSELVEQDRKSTRLNSSHSQISYAVFCLKKKNNSNRLHSQDVRGEQVADHAGPQVTILFHLAQRRSADLILVGLHSHLYARDTGLVITSP